MSGAGTGSQMQTLWDIGVLIDILAASQMPALVLVVPTYLLAINLTLDDFCISISHAL